MRLALTLALLLLLTAGAAAWRLRPQPSPAARAVDPTTLITELEPAAIGLPLYPEATPVGRATRQEGPGWSHTAVVLVTPAEPGRVAEFYVQRLEGAQRFDSGDMGTVLTRRTPQGFDTVRVAREGEATTILLSRRAERDAPPAQ